MAAQGSQWLHVTTETRVQFIVSFNQNVPHETRGAKLGQPTTRCYWCAFGDC